MPPTSAHVCNAPSASSLAEPSLSVPNVSTTCSTTSYGTPDAPPSWPFELSPQQAMSSSAPSEFHPTHVCAAPATNAPCVWTLLVCTNSVEQLPSQLEPTIGALSASSSLRPQHTIDANNPDDAHTWSAPTA